MLYFSFINSISGGETDLSKKYNAEKKLFEFGQPPVAPADKTARAKNKKTAIVPSVSTANRLQIKHQSIDFYLENQQLTDSRLNYGLIMHEILQNICFRKDQETAIRRLITEGRITEAESEIIRRKFEEFWSIPQVSEWFSEEQQVLNEASILTPNGNIYRPDRVVINGKNATVVDYKFGDAESETYNRQVKRYMELIEKMGYEVAGFLCYVSLGKVVKIE